MKFSRLQAIVVVRVCRFGVGGTVSPYGGAVVRQYNGAQLWQGVVGGFFGGVSLARPTNCFRFLGFYFCFMFSTYIAQCCYAVYSGLYTQVILMDTTMKKRNLYKVSMTRFSYTCAWLSVARTYFRNYKRTRMCFSTWHNNQHTRVFFFATKLSHLCF